MSYKSKSLHTSKILETSKNSRSFLLKINKNYQSPLKFYRQKAGLSQSKLALLSGISQATISNIESGYIEPSLDIAFSISNVLDLDFDKFHTELKEFYNENLESMRTGVTNEN